MNDHWQDVGVNKRLLLRWLLNSYGCGLDTLVSELGPYAAVNVQIPYMAGELFLLVERFYSKVAQIFRICRSRLKILGAVRVIWNVFRTEYPHILGTMVRNLVDTASWRPGFMHLCFTGFRCITLIQEFISLLFFIILRITRKVLQNVKREKSM